LPIKVLVAYASRAGSTKGIAEFVGGKLQRDGAQTDVRDVGSIADASSYDAFVIGSALYMYHWLKEAREFVSRNRSVLAGRPVWLLSSGPTSLEKTDKKGRNLLEVMGPKEIDELRGLTNPRDHRVFYGAFYPDHLKGALGFFARAAPKDEVGDFRNWSEIEAWTNEIAEALGQRGK